MINLQVLKQLCRVLFSGLYSEAGGIDYQNVSWFKNSSFALWRGNVAVSLQKYFRGTWYLHIILHLGKDQQKRDTHRELFY